jgi:hypothetical protein
MQFVFKTIWSIVLCCCAALLYAADSGVAYGSAYSVDDGRLLFTETHRWSGAQHTVEYFRPGGDLIAVNQLDSSTSFVSPSYKQNYPGDGFSEGARWQGSELILFSADKQRAVEFKPPLVLSSGFYHFILDHWRELHQGQVLVFDFAVPSQLTTVRLRMHALSNGATAMGKDAQGDPGWFYVRVEAANRLLSWLIKPLTVALDDQRRLMLYRGISNVRDDEGHQPQVLIRYRYPERALSSAAVPADSAAFTR